MDPVSICTKILTSEKYNQIIEELSSSQIKVVLKTGNAKLKSTGRYVTQKKKRELWAKKINAGIEQENQSLAAELLQQWLLGHRREFLTEYLDALGVKHINGETEDSFLVTVSKDTILAEAEKLLAKHDKQEFGAYLAFIAFQQNSDIYSEWGPMMALSN